MSSATTSGGGETANRPVDAGPSRLRAISPRLFRLGWKVALVAGVACLATAGGMLSRPTGSATVTQTNPGNAFETGTVLVNGAPNGGPYIINVTGAAPGDAPSNTYTLQNVGSMSATMTLQISAVTADALASRLTLEVLDTTTGSDVAGLTSSSNTTLAAANGVTYSLPGSSTAQWTSTETHVLEFIVRFPSAGPGNDDSLQGQSASFSVAFTGNQ